MFKTIMKLRSTLLLSVGANEIIYRSFTSPASEEKEKKQEIKSSETQKPESFSDSDDSNPENFSKTADDIVAAEKKGSSSDANGELDKNEMKSHINKDKNKNKDKNDGKNSITDLPSEDKNSLDFDEK